MKHRNDIIVITVLIGIMIFLNQCAHTRKDKLDEPGNPDMWDASIRRDMDDLYSKGKQVFRFETFGDEAFWSGKLRLHEAIAGSEHGGVGEGLTPKAALEAGLKVDLDVLPAPLRNAVREGKLLDDVGVTLQLIRLDAVLGVKGKFEGDDLVEIGLTCAVCHSSVEHKSGIGSRLDGFPNQDLNVGAIVSMAPNLEPIAQLLETDVETVKKVLASWGPGMYDAVLNMDGKAFKPDGGSAATRIPPAFNTAGKNNHTWGGGWGNVTYWNAYVANTQLYGQGTFFDERLMDATHYPIAAKAGFGNKRDPVDSITNKLAALHFYQLSIPAPEAPKGSFDEEAAARGRIIFNGKGKCSQCHVPPLYTEPGWNTHRPEDIGIDDFQANRYPDSTLVTPSLKGLWAHSKRGFYHDGRFKSLMEVVDHYDNFKKLGLSPAEKQDLVEFIKSL